MSSVRCRSKTSKFAAGQVGQQPAVPGQQYQISVRAGRQAAARPSQFDNIILKTNSDGTLVRLKDVGRAELRRRKLQQRLCSSTGKDAVGIGVTQLSTANAIDVDRLAIAETRPPLEKISPGNALQSRIRHHDAVGESIRDVVYTVGSGHLPGHPCDLYLSRRLEDDDDSLYRHSGFAHRHLHLRQVAGVLHQHAYVVRHHARHRPGRRRRYCRD